MLALTMRKSEEIHCTNEDTGDTIVLRLSETHRRPSRPDEVRINIVAPHFIKIHRRPNTAPWREPVPAAKEQ